MTNVPFSINYLSYTEAVKSSKPIAEVSNVFRFC